MSSFHLGRSALAARSARSCAVALSSQGDEQSPVEPLADLRRDPAVVVGPSGAPCAHRRPRRRRFELPAVASAELEAPACRFAITKPRPVHSPCWPARGHEDHCRLGCRTSGDGRHPHGLQRHGPDPGLRHPGGSAHGCAVTDLCNGTARSPDFVIAARSRARSILAQLQRHPAWVASRSVV